MRRTPHTRSRRVPAIGRMVGAGLVACLGLAVAPGGPAAARVARAAATVQAYTQSHARLEALAADGRGGVILLTADPAGDHLWVVDRRGSGATAPRIDLADGTSVDDAVLAIAADGTGVVSWDSVSRDGTVAVRARVRHRDGSWGPVSVLARGDAVDGPTQVLAGPGGRAAVTFYGQDYQPRVGVRRGAGWSAAPLTPGGGGYTPTFAFGPRGTLVAALVSDPHGGGGDLALSRLAAGARQWTRPVEVPTPPLADDPVQLSIGPRGRVLLAYGYVADDGYRVPGDGDVVGSTAYRVVAQRVAGAPVRTLWDRPAAAAASLSIQGSQARVTWSQWTGHRAPGLSRRSVVHTRRLTPAPGPQVRLTSAPTRPATSPTFQLAAAGGDVGAVSWAPSARVDARVLVRAVGPGATGRSVLLDAAAREPHGWLPAPADVVVSGGRAWVAWMHDDTGPQGSDGAGGYADSEVSLLPL